MTAERRVAFVHFHLRPGGVTRVMDHAVMALRPRGVHTAVLVGDMPAANTASLDRVRLVGELAYDSPVAMSPAELADRLAAAARSVLGADPDIWHVHNHSLGKNLVVPLIVGELAARGCRILLQIHDFPEDGRPSNYRFLLDGLAGGRIEDLGARLYPQGENVHYAALNGRDRDFLRAAGVEETRLHLLPNAVWLGEYESYRDEEGRKPEQRLFLYPTRAIRRKNLGEFLLWSTLAGGGDQFATTLEPENPVERKVYEGWVNLVRELRLPVRLGVGTPSRAHFFDLLQSSHALVTTSVAEGFGLAFLEPWLVGRPVLGRNLHEITKEFEEAGIDLGGLYRKVEVPLACIGLNPLRTRIEQGLRRTLKAYGREATAADTERAVAASVTDGRVDFGKLDEDLQAEVIRKMRGEESLRRDVLPASLIDGGDSALRAERNRKVVQETYSLEQYGGRLQAVYERLMACGTRPAPPLSAETLLDQYLSPERFSLLRT